MAYWRLHYHLVWATHRRAPMIDAASEIVVRRTLYGKAKELGLLIHGLGNVADHIHVVVSIPPKIPIAECVRQLKGASSHAVNMVPGASSPFRWQDGYGALSIGERSLASVVAYAANQKDHHQQRTTIAIYERYTEEDDGVAVRPTRTD
jgi:putative transposase